MSDFDIFVEAMCDEAIGDSGKKIREGVIDSPIVRSAITNSMLAGLNTRQALQTLAAVMIEQNRVLRSELLKVHQHLPPQPIAINGVRYNPIPGDAKP
jgi:hypothetical protein